MLKLFINDKETDILFDNLKEAIVWIELHSSRECHPTGFTLTEFFDPANLTYYNFVEEND